MGCTTGGARHKHRQYRSPSSHGGFRQRPLHAMLRSEPSDNARPEPQHSQDEAIQDSARKGIVPIQDCECQRAQDHTH
jgi:hypothetical protein